MVSNKKGVAFTWMYGLAFIFALGIMYSVFLFAFEGHLVPTIKEAANNTISSPTEIATINDGIDSYMSYFKLMPFILFAVVVIYMFATSIYQQGGNRF